MILGSRSINAHKIKFLKFFFFFYLGKTIRENFELRKSYRFKTIVKFCVRVTGKRFKIIVTLSVK